MRETARAPEATSRPRPCKPGSHRRSTAESTPVVAKLFRALGDETRLAIVEMILAAGELCACDIESNFALSQPTISHHIKLLRTAGVIEGERRGTWIYYRLVPGALEALTAHPVLRFGA